MIPTRRDLHFNLTQESVRDWHAQGSWLTHFINAMSIFFPDGERYFIHTVRHYRDRITDPELQKAVTAFIGQEAMHSREHEEHSRLLAEIGLPTPELERHIHKMFELLKTWLPPSAQLSATIAQEHFTAITAQLVLTDERLLAGADRRMRAMLRWHALEETEHKAVAFDVYETVMGRGARSYALRTAGLVLTTIVFVGLVLYYQQRMLQAEGGPRRWRDALPFAKFMFFTPAYFTRLVPGWLDYLRPGFHPWDFDNSYLLKEMDELVAELGDEIKKEERKAA